MSVIGPFPGSFGKPTPFHCGPGQRKKLLAEAVSDAETGERENSSIPVSHLAPLQVLFLHQGG